jgi:hypothetical protein
MAPIIGRAEREDAGQRRPLTVRRAGGSGQLATAPELSPADRIHRGDPIAG